MASPDEHIDVSVLTYDDIAEIDLEIPELEELTLFQKFLTFVELVMVGYLFYYCIFSVVDNAGTVADVLSKSFIFD